MSNTNVKVSILGRDFTIGCPPDEQEDLLSAAQFLDENMKQIQATGKVIGSERCAIMAALNISNELLKLQRNTNNLQQVGSKIQNIQNRVDAALEELEI